MRQHWRGAVQRPESAAARRCVRMCANAHSRRATTQLQDGCPPRSSQWSDYRRVRRYWDVPRHLWHGTRALNRAASSAEHAQPLPQTHHTVRIELASALRAKQINVARLSIGRVCSRHAGLERSVRHCTALQASCSTGVAADAPKSLRRRTIGSEQAASDRAQLSDK